MRAVIQCRTYGAALSYSFDPIPAQTSILHLRANNSSHTPTIIHLFKHLVSQSSIPDKHGFTCGVIRSYNFGRISPWRPFVITQVTHTSQIASHCLTLNSIHSKQAYTKHICQCIHFLPVMDHLDSSLFSEFTTSAQPNQNAFWSHHHI